MTFTSAGTIDDHLANHVAQGFTLHEPKARHPPGLRNGFVALNFDYLELCWVERQPRYAWPGGALGRAGSARWRRLSVQILPAVQSLRERVAATGEQPELRLLASG